MAISYINTTEVDNISREIISLTNDLDNEINNLFKRFSDVSNITQEWVGSQSKIYFKKVAGEKKQYTDFINKLKEIGNKLSKDVYQINSCVKTNITSESQKDY